MKTKLNLVIFIAMFIVIIGGSYVAYNNLAAGSSAKLMDIGGAKPEQPAQEATASDSNQKTPASDKPVSTLAPDFALYDKDGNKLSLSELKGKPIVLNFWASWCPPCKQEMPFFNSVYKEMGEEVTFVMVDLTDGIQETQESGQAFIDESGYEFPVYFDLDQEAVKKYRIGSIPTTYFIDAEGHLVTGAQGAISEENLRVGIQMAKDA